MEIQIDAGTLKFFHDTLVELYRNTDDPITLGHSKGMLQVCAEKPFIEIYHMIPFPHIYHKATVLMDTIIRFHPFIDGNKRASLLTTYFFLYWNGYDFIIPKDADEFTIEVAEGKHDLDSILSWLYQHSVRSFGSTLRHRLCSTYLAIGGAFPSLTKVMSAFVPFVFFTTYPLNYFSYHISKNRKNKP